jgi:hypothetical protein
VAAEVTRDRNQKTESAEKEGGKQFWVCEINEDFRLMARPGFPQPFGFSLVASAPGLIKGEIRLYELGDCLPPISSSGNGDLAPHFILYQDQTAQLTAARLLKCAVLFGTRSAQSIRASGHTRRINRPDT